ncbi:AraC family transcriptional regulator [Clostridium bowmanii]|uniref:helix-turn-helix domain-containing protein n=1 Tax=Clostridium bowmanii TaxID=132925 RepID=UPI001C0D8A14|nr:AraC family transcriptional regulator [Clostridium bowmanii]MBU3191922.1 AraC family transcriptional regulator [Clostridium bowmanii]MCA1076181.1 AraC family transcriptional regulator [Clostridium bowmanii]
MEDIYKKLESTMARNRYTSYIHPPYALECKLVQAIKQMDYDKSIKALNQINSLERAELSKRPLSSLKYSLIASCTFFTRAIIEAGLDTETSFMLSDYYINLIDETATISEVQALEYKMLNDFIMVLKKYKENIYNPLINRVITYINKNIENNLSLAEISSFVNVHPNYLCAAFKKEVSKTLSEYINDQRIIAIKLYMNHANSSISEISYAFNFSHVTYFCRFFKKQTGITPSEYKKQCSSTNSLVED